MTSEKRLIEIPADRILIMQGDSIVGERIIDLSYLSTVDAVEVVHRWWDVEVGMNYNKERICTVCKKHVKSNFWNYCPNCGAKMDGDKYD